jgi:hypothetical protein
MTTFYCPRLETPPTWRTRSPVYILKEQGGPVIPPGTGFPFCRLLQLAGLRWRYSTPPPHGISRPHYTVSDSRLPQPWGTGPLFISKRNRVARLFPQVLSSLFVASYNSQDYGGGIRLRLHTGFPPLLQTVLPITFRHEPHRNYRLLTIPQLLQRCVHLIVA